MIKSTLHSTEFKEQAASLQARLKSLGVAITLQQAYEGLSASYGARNWHAMNTEVLSKNALPRLNHKIHLFMDFWSHDDYAELPEYAYLDLSNKKTIKALWASRQMSRNQNSCEVVNSEVALNDIAQNVRTKYEDCHIDEQSFWFSLNKGFDDESCRSNSLYFSSIQHVLEKGSLPEACQASERFLLKSLKDKSGQECILLFWSNHSAERLKHLVGKCILSEAIPARFDIDSFIKAIES